MNEYKETIEEITSLFVNKEITDVDQKIDMLNTQYELLTSLFEQTKKEEDKQWAVKYAVKYSIPLSQDLLADPSVSEDETKIVYGVHRKIYAFCGRRSLAHFIDFMEWDRPTHDKIFINRRAVLNPIVYYLNKIMFDDTMNTLVVSLPPGYGKTFTLNYFTAWMFGINRNSSFLRLSYSEELLNGFSRSIKDLVCSDLFAEIFPDFKRYNGKPFDKEKDDGWKLKNADVIVSHYIRTRDGASTGVRANAAIILDDITKGSDESNDDDLHEKYWRKFTTEWWNRRKDDKIKYIFVGTMWTPKDILNRITEKETKISKEVPSTKFKYVWECEDGHAAFIRIPLLDENDMSTCPSVMSTREALQLREITDEYLFSCVYQQDPIAPSGLEFSYANLRTYEELPKTEKGLTDINAYAFAALDPTRRGKDNVAMPIFRTTLDGEDHYMVDCIYQKKPMTEVYDLIIDKIIQHKIIRLMVENNTDVSLKSLLEMKLKQKGISFCIIDEKFNTPKKEVRIKDMRGLIIRKMLFKKKGMVGVNSDYGRFMDAFTKYSFDYANKNDDAPDSLALYVAEIIEGSNTNTFEVIDRKRLGW